MIVFIVDSAGNYLVSRSLPPPRDRELGGIYFIKVSSSKITRDNVHDAIIANDLPPSTCTPLQMLMLFVREAYFPVLTNAKNQASSLFPTCLFSIRPDLTQESPTIPNHSIRADVLTGACCAAGGLARRHIQGGERDLRQPPRQHVHDHRGRRRQNLAAAPVPSGLHTVPRPARQGGSGEGEVCAAAKLLYAADACRSHDSTLILTRHASLHSPHAACLLIRALRVRGLDVGAGCTCWKIPSSCGRSRSARS